MRTKDYVLLLLISQIIVAALLITYVEYRLDQHRGDIALTQTLSQQPDTNASPSTQRMQLSEILERADQQAAELFRQQQIFDFGQLPSAGEQTVTYAGQRMINGEIFRYQLTLTPAEVSGEVTGTVDLDQIARELENYGARVDAGQALLTFVVPREQADPVLELFGLRTR